MLREIRLYGDLGKQFGRVHHMAVESAAEAIRALVCNFQGFEKALIEAPGWRIWSGSDRLQVPEDTLAPAGTREIIRIAPAIAGAGKGGLGQILMGAAIVGMAFATGGASLGFTGAYGLGLGVTTTAMGSIAMNLATSLVIGGIVQMLSPSPNNNPADANSAENKPSYVFNGAVNTTAQGSPVPVGYGRLIVGSAVVSSGITSEEMGLTLEEMKAAELAAMGN